MFKLSKKADYGLIAMKHLANHREQHACSASEIAEEYGISATLMAKVLQKLARQNLVAAKHGSNGGYTRPLTRSAVMKAAATTQRRPTRRSPRPSPSTGEPSPIDVDDARAGGTDRCWLKDEFRGTGWSRRG